MSTEIDDGDIRVEDDEEIVDRKTKNQILNLREHVDESERALYVERMSDPDYQLSITDANQYWGLIIRQYLRGIKRLWGEPDELPIKNVTKYWEEIEIGREVLVPPDQAGIQFSMMANHEEYDESQLRQYLGLPRGASLPYPQPAVFRGLASVLNTNRIEHRWVVETNMEGPPPQHEHVTLSVSMPIPKHILENAVEAADTFLQQAGMGFEVGAPPYMGGEEPGL